MKTFSELLFSFGLKTMRSIVDPKIRNIPFIAGKIFVFFGFVLLVPGVSHSKVKIDSETVKAVSVGIQSLENMELVLKYFFKKPKDRRQIDRDLVQMAKYIKKMKWYAESDGRNGLFVKSKKKVLFKFRLLSKGKEFSDFAFNINGRKFAINPSRSYAWHIKELENILGRSKTGLLEGLVVNEARAFFFIIGLAVAALAATTWSARAKENKTGKQKQSASEVKRLHEKPTPLGNECAEGHYFLKPSEGHHADGMPETGGCISKEECEKKGKEAKTNSSGDRVCETESSSDSPASSSDSGSCEDDKKGLYEKCVNHNQKKTVSEINKEYRPFILNYSHFIEKEESKAPPQAPPQAPPHRFYDACYKKKETRFAEKVKEMCSGPGYAKLAIDDKLFHLGNRLPFLINKSVRTTHKDQGSVPKFLQRQCNNFATHDAEDEANDGWGMTKEAAKMYCEKAEELHGQCERAAKSCLSEPVAKESASTGSGSNHGTDSIH